MNANLRMAMIAAATYKDNGYMASAGATLSRRSSHKQYLRKNHLGKFAKGRK